MSAESDPVQAAVARRITGLAPGGLRRVEIGGGALAATATGLRLLTADTTARRYANAQLDDYQGRARRDFPWRPPLTLTVQARFSHPDARRHPRSGLRGTAGFGFWNDPFLMTELRFPALPRALWFFYASPPSDMALDLRAPGCGWKAAAIDARPLPAAAAALSAPVAVPLLNIRRIYRAVWPAYQRALRIREASVEADMTAWHTYVIEWGVAVARFRVDGALVLEGPAPRGPLGLVIWLDNQFLVATPWGRLRYGWLDAPGEQWLEVARADVRPERQTLDRPGTA